MKYSLDDSNFSKVDQKLREDFYMDVSSNLEEQFRKYFKHDLYWFGISKVLCSDLWMQFSQFRNPVWNRE